jgi:AcrR family transcriptional regulator
MSMYARRSPTATALRTRARIIDAVRELLAEGAFHDSTVEAVADRAGVSRATLYQHFGSRLGLVDAMCESFDANPALVAVRQATDLDDFLARVVDFWAAEEKVLVQLYGAAAVDPAAGDLVERQTRDRQGEIRRLLRSLGRDDKSSLASLSLLTSFETFQQLRRRVGMPKRDVVATLQAAAARLLA